MVNMIVNSTVSMWGIIIPALIFIFSFIVTYLLYRHFSKHLTPTSTNKKETK